jgi:hypothetical protein
MATAVFAGLDMTVAAPQNILPMSVIADVAPKPLPSASINFLKSPRMNTFMVLQRLSPHFLDASLTLWR